LSEFLNKYYKVNFCTWINTLRVEEVKRLLVERPNLSLADISVMVGFSDPASLSKIFKKISNESPSSYKKRLAM
jgi:transcriptional regulator GlxA family with amidase domain